MKFGATWLLEHVLRIRWVCFLSLIALSYLMPLLWTAGCTPAQDNSGESQRNQRPTSSLPSLKSISFTQPFPHSKHVFRESNAECVRCHRSQKNGTISTDFSSCQSCHQREVQVQFKVKSASVLSQFSSFSHRLHQIYACVLCHQQVGVSRGKYRRMVPWDMCSKCHKDHTNFERLSSCSRCHQLPFGISQGEKGVFSHKDHVKGNNCTLCHQEVPRKQTIVEVVIQPSHSIFTQELCRNCHINSTVEIVSQKKRKIPPVAFSHSLHLAKIKNCDVCHWVEKSGKIVFKKRLPTYEGCLSCHSSWRVKKHKDVENCLKCHDPEVQGRLKTVEVSTFKRVFQRSPHGVHFQEHHKFLKDCQKCHLKEKANPKRLKPFVFNHNSHLPLHRKKLKQNCLKCHRHTYEEQPGRVDYQVCASCHSPQMKLQEKALVQREIRVAFSHQQHRRLDCLVCHNLGAKERLPLNIMKCAECHSPTVATDLSLNRKNFHEPCLRCHTGFGILQRKDTFLRKVQTVRLQEGKVEHNLSSALCIDCHVSQRTKRLLPQTTEVVRKVAGLDHHLRSRGKEDCGNCHIRKKLGVFSSR